MAAFSEAAGRAVPVRGLRRLHGEGRDAGLDDYRGYEVYKNPSANQGPAELFALNMLEGFDLPKMGLNSADYIHTSAEAVKLAMGDREKYLGDTDFITIPYEGLLSKAYAAERRKLIDPARASLELQPGDPSRFMTRAAALVGYPYHATLEGDAAHDGDTSYLAVVDKNRNMVSFEPSLHAFWGTKVVMARSGHHLQLPGRLLLARRRRSQRARARQAAAHRRCRARW